MERPATSSSISSAGSLPRSPISQCSPTASSLSLAHPVLLQRPWARMQCGSRMPQFVRSFSWCCGGSRRNGGLASGSSANSSLAPIARSPGWPMSAVSCLAQRQRSWSVAFLRHGTEPSPSRTDSTDAHGIPPAPSVAVDERRRRRLRAVLGRQTRR